MATIIRQDSDPRTVRPDGVYRTGVLTSIYGYQPDNDTQAVLARFANGPANLGGFGAPNAFQRLGLRIKAWAAQRKAKQFMAAAAASPEIAAAHAAAVSGRSPSEPAINEGNMVAPQIAAQMRHLRALGPDAGGGYKIATETVPQRRWNTYYRAG